MNHVIWNMVGTTVYNSVMEEWQVSGVKSTLGQVNLIAESYGLEPVSQCQLDPIQIKQVIRRKHDQEVWRDCYASPIAQVRTSL